MDKECDLNNQKIVINPWYVIRTFNCQEIKICDFLKEKGKIHFVPMAYAEKIVRAKEKEQKEKVQRILVPVVHNMVFLQKDESQKALLNLLKECNVPLSVLCKEGTSRCYEIPDNQMTEFRALCDPNFEDTVFITHDEAEAKPGREVRIIHGQFAGMCGKLHRVKNNYFFIKTLVGVGVMIRISRWYCQLI